MNQRLVCGMFLMAMASVWAADGTLKWKGAASGGEWGDAANWEVGETSGFTVQELLTKKTIWDFSTLEDGAVVSNNAAGTIIAGIRLPQTNSGTITLAGTKDFTFPNADVQTTIGAGTTLEWQINHTSPWGNDTANKKWIILGDGTLHLNPSSSIDTYKLDLQPCHASTVVLGPRYYSAKSFVTLYNTATLRLEATFTTSMLRMGHVGCTVDLNGHDCYVNSGEAPQNGGVQDFCGQLIGKGNLYYSGGENWSMGREATPGLFSDDDRWIRVYDGRLAFPVAFTFPDSLHLALNAGGTLALNSSATVNRLAGTGASGFVQVADGKTLTVTGPAQSNDVLCARLAGNADFVKDGADYTLTLSGDNRHTGATTVAAGTLALKRPFVRKGRVRYWSFDDPENLGRDYGEYGCPLYENGTAKPFSTNGVHGGRAAYFPGTSSDKSYLQSNMASPENGFPVKSKAVSVSFWLKPDAGSKKNPSYVYRHGNFGGDGRQLVFWIVDQGKELELLIDNWLTTDTVNSPRFKVDNLFDGNWHHVAFGYDANTLKVWYDGTLKSTKEGTHPLSISAGQAIQLGNAYESDKCFQGALDEVSVWDHLLTDDEVAAEYAFVSEATDPATLLPEPVCHWAFDDASIPGKATKGGVDLVQLAGVGSAPALVANASAFSGQALHNGTVLTAAASSLPANFPKGDSPYTVSIRMASCGLQENCTLLAFGDPSATATRFRFFNSGCPRVCRLSAGNKSDVRSTWSCCNMPSSFTHFVVTVDPQVNLLRLYRDGVQEQIVYDFKGTIGDGDLFLGGDTSKTTSAKAQFDDVRIYNVALSPEEVRTLAASLETGVRGPVLPATSPVTVAAGATLAVDAETTDLHSVAGAGILSLGAGASLLAHDWTDFTGSITGPGRVLLPTTGCGLIGAASVAVDVAFEDNTVALTAANVETPLVTTTGKVLLPETGTLKLVDAKGSGSWSGKTFRLAVCSSWEGPETATGWTFEPTLSGSDWTAKCRFEFKDGELLLKLPGAGTVFLFR